MKTVCTIVAAMLPLFCSAAKLTHYADSGFVVKYPRNDSSNAVPANHPRWLDEQCIPGGANPTQQVKRITLDVACSMAGTADAYLRRNIAASLYGTKEMAGVMLGTNFVTGYEYATTNLIGGPLFDRYVLVNKNEHPEWQVVQYPFAYTNLDYYGVVTNRVSAGKTRRLFADQYLTKPYAMLWTVDQWIDRPYGPTYAFTIAELLDPSAGAGFSSDRYDTFSWMHNIPSVVDRYGNQGRAFYHEGFDYGYYGPAMSWGASAAEKAVYSGISSSSWVRDPRDLVTDWSRFYPTLAVLFLGTNSPPYNATNYKVIDWSVLDSVPGTIAFQVFDGDDVDHERAVRGLRLYLQGYDGSDPDAWEMVYRPYPGRDGWELMSDTCGRVFTNFTSIVSTRMEYEPWEQCNAFLGLMDTLYVGQGAMPEFWYAETNEVAKWKHEWGVRSVNFTLVRESYDYPTWHPESFSDLVITSHVVTVTNYVSATASTQQKTVAFDVPTPIMFVDAVNDNHNFSWICHDQYQQIREFMDMQAIGRIFRLRILWPVPWSPGVNAATVIEDNDTGYSEFIVDWPGSTESIVNFEGWIIWEPQSQKTSTTLTDYDHRLMNPTNSMPCCHPIEMNPPLDDVAAIHLSCFSGVHSTTNTDEIGRAGFFGSASRYDSLSATNRQFNLGCDDASSASEVDSKARQAEDTMSAKMNDTCRGRVSADENTDNLQHLQTCWDVPDAEGILQLFNDHLKTNEFFREAVSPLVLSQGCQIMRYDESTVVVRYLDGSEEDRQWREFLPAHGDDAPWYLRVDWVFRGDSMSFSTEDLRLKPSFVGKGATTSIEAVQYDFKTMRREN